MRSAQAPKNFVGAEWRDAPTSLHSFYGANSLPQKPSDRARLAGKNSVFVIVVNIVFVFIEFFFDEVF